MVFRMIHVKASLLPMGKVWSLDFLGYHASIPPKTNVICGFHVRPQWTSRGTWTACLWAWARCRPYLGGFPMEIFGIITKKPSEGRMKQGCDIPEICVEHVFLAYVSWHFFIPESSCTTSAQHFSFCMQLARWLWKFKWRKPSNKTIGSPHQFIRIIFSTILQNVQLQISGAMLFFSFEVLYKMFHSCSWCLKRLVRQECRGTSQQHIGNLVFTLRSDPTWWMIRKMWEDSGNHGRISLVPGACVFMIDSYRCIIHVRIQMYVQYVCR